MNKGNRKKTQFLTLLIFPAVTVTIILVMTHKTLDGTPCNVRGCFACPRNAVIWGFFFFEVRTIQVNLEDKLSRQMEAEEFKEYNHSI